MKQSDHTQRSRLPKGIASKNPVPMRLSDDERAKLNELAVKECRSASSMARIVFLKGLSAFATE